MLLLGAPVFLWSFLVVQVLGVIAATATMICRLPSRLVFCQRAFLATLLLVACHAMWLVAMDHSFWVSACPTLAFMVLGVTFDCGDRNQSASY